MNRTRTGLALALVVAATAAVGHAQQQPPAGGAPRAPQGQGPRDGMGGPMGRMRDGGRGMRPMGGAPGGGNIASMLLGHTADLKLSDAQVTRLAAIARRTEDRHRAMRAQMDSMFQRNRAQNGTAGAPPAAMPEQARAMMDRARDQEHADVRDALAVLTPDQQADAWMMRGGMGGRPRG